MSVPKTTTTATTTLPSTRNPRLSLTTLSLSTATDERIAQSISARNVDEIFCGAGDTTLLQLYKETT